MTAVQSFMNFDPNASYDQIGLAKPESPPRPDIVSKLDFDKLKLY